VLKNTDYLSNETSYEEKLFEIGGILNEKLSANFKNKYKFISPSIKSYKFNKPIFSKHPVGEIAIEKYKQARKKFDDLIGNNCFLSLFSLFFSEKELVGNIPIVGFVKADENNKDDSIVALINIGKILSLVREYYNSQQKTLKRGFFGHTILQTLKTEIENLHSEFPKQLREGRGILEKKINNLYDLPPNESSKESYLAFLITFILYDQMIEEDWKVIYHIASYIGSNAIAGFILGCKEILTLEEIDSFIILADEVFSSLSVNELEEESRQKGALEGWLTLASNVGHNVKNLLAGFYYDTVEKLRNKELAVVETSRLNGPIEKPEEDLYISADTEKIRTGLEVCFSSLAWLKVAGKGIRKEEARDYWIIKNIVCEPYFMVYSSLLLRLPEEIVTLMKQRANKKINKNVFVPPVLSLNVQTEQNSFSFKILFLPIFIFQPSIWTQFGMGFQSVSEGRQSLKHYVKESFNDRVDVKFFRGCNDLYPSKFSFDEQVQLLEGLETVFYEIFYNSLWKGILDSFEGNFPFVVKVNVKFDKGKTIIEIVNPWSRPRKIMDVSGLRGVKDFFRKYNQGLIDKKLDYRIYYEDSLDDNILKEAIKSYEWICKIHLIRRNDV